MIWRNPWAWLGLVSIAVPVLIHLLARRTARVRRFPTLRFLPDSRVRARRIQLHDPLLLCLRLLILVAAVAALAQPFVPIAARVSRTAGSIARVIVVDTSASMRRAAVTGVRALDAARDSARSYADAAGVVIETGTPARALAGAAAWLETQSGPREIVIISDFQAGTMEAVDLESVPRRIGVRLVRVVIARDSAQMTFLKANGDGETTVRVTHAPEALSAEWTTRRANARTPSALHVVSPVAVREAANAAVDAALAVGAPFHADTARPVAIVFPGSDMPVTGAADRAWMSDVIARLAREPLLDRVGRGMIDNREHLLLFTNAEPGSIESAAFAKSALEALDSAPPAAELEPALIPTDSLARWSRPPQPDPRATGTDASDGRWFWLAALLLIGTESWLRWRRAHAHA